MFSKRMKQLGVLALGFAMSVSLICPTGTAVLAAKAPAMNKKVVNIKKGSSATIKLKNVNKKAKVSWSVKSKKIAKITKSTKTSAKVKGVKVGKTTVTAKYTLNKKTKKLVCSVVVKSANDVTATNTPAATATATPVATAPVATATATPTATVAPTEAPWGWASTWGTAEEKNDIDTGAMSFVPLDGTTVRQIIKVTTSGEKFRLRLSNQYGKSPVVIESMHIAKQGPEADKSTIDVATDTVVTVGGSETFEIPAGQVIVTDEINFSIKALENVAISTYFTSAPTANITGHRGARATTYQVSGNSVSTETLASPKTCKSWFFLADASIWIQGGKAVVCFGDSITDGYGTDADYLGKKPDSYTRWGDYFAKRLQANEATKNVSVINEGIGANSILGSYPTDAGKDRFERDLSQHDGVAYCIILFGVNDLNKLPNTDKFAQLKPEYQKMIETCHDYGVKVYAAPILPFGTSDYYSEASEQVRTMINDWFRSKESDVDGIIDFESALSDPNNPKSILEAYTHSDGLHPYDGYNVMADAIDLKMFE